MISIEDIKKFFTAKRLIFIALFAIFAFITQRINFSALVGTDNQFFTLFQFFGPIAGAFLGPIVGVVAVFLAEATDFLVVGKELTWINIARLVPMLFATYYFATNKKILNIFIPIASIAIFLMHPIGRTVWFFTLFWTIPILLKIIPQKYSNTVPAKSLGATFTAHSVGGALWIWTIPMTAQMWINLVPVVAYERLLFALGIAISYIGINFLLDLVLNKFKIDAKNVLNIDKKFTLKA